nr:hypothetical protein [Tanacetum cinerariifolium]
MSNPHPKRNLVPRAVLIRSGFKTLNTTRQNSSRAVVSVNTTRQINTAYPRPTLNSARPASNVFNRVHSHDKRPINNRTSSKNSKISQKVNTIRAKHVSTARPKAVLNTIKGNQVNVVKASACWVWRPKQKVLDHVSRNNGASITFKRFNYVDAQGRSKKQRRQDTKLPQTSVPKETVADEAVNEEMYDSLERVTTTATRLDAKQDRGNISKTQSNATPNEPSSPRTSSGGGPRCQDTTGDTIAQTRSENVSEQSNDPPLSRVNTLGNYSSKGDFNIEKKSQEVGKEKKSRTDGLNRFYKVGLSARLESSAKEQSLGKEDASKQGRNIADIDADAEITLVDETDVQNVVKKVIEDITTAGIKETVSTAASITTTDVAPDELTMAQALVEIKKSKSKGATTTTTTITIPTPDSTRPKARGVVMQEPSETLTTTTILISLKIQDKRKGIMVEEPLKMKKKDQISFDKQEARRLQVKFDEKDKLVEEKAQLIKDENLA